MPIKAENKHKYPSNWKDLSWQVRTKAGNRCELCDVFNGALRNATEYREGRSNTIKVVLTVHHLDFHPENNEVYNLIALCQRCHNRLDAKWRARNRKLNEAQRKGER